MNQFWALYHVSTTLSVSRSSLHYMQNHREFDSVVLIGQTKGKDGDRQTIA
ncbi:MAG: hypothetical protein OJF50_006042 [Nitrospira sp.]|nr:hypothetical protein [Nitrospira sp.]